MSARLDFLSREFLASPQPYLTELRHRGPVVQVDPGGMWAVTRYDEAQHVLKSASLVSSQGLRLTAQPEWLQRVNPFADSLLFLDPPQHGRLRALLCTQDVTLAGVELPQGALVLVSLASAARDEKYFPEGDRFILEREGPPRLSFGHGPHYCMGAMLARLEARVALEELVSCVDRLELRTEHIEWTTSLIVRGPVTLPVEVFASAPGQPLTARLA